VPTIPDPVLALSGLVLRKDQAILLLLATLMFGVAAAMLRGVHDGQERGAAHVHVEYPLVIPLGGPPAPVSGGSGGSRPRLARTLD